MAKAPANLRSLARAHTDMALRTLCGIAMNGENESARVAASVHILDRGWGKAPTTHTGEDGEGAINVVIRHIIEEAHAKAPRGNVELERNGDDAKLINGDATVDQGESAEVITLVQRRKTDGDGT